MKQHKFPLPWLMTDMRPQRYLGRFFPLTYSDLGLPARITDWSEDQALYAIGRRGEDVPGNLLIGDESHARWLTRAEKHGEACVEILRPAAKRRRQARADLLLAEPRLRDRRESHPADIRCRFDRTGEGGRMGVVSLGADDARELRFLSAFGALIGNTDMHLGNASFPTDGYLGFGLPAYDLLPMMYAPG